MNPVSQKYNKYSKVIIFKVFYFILLLPILLGFFMSIVLYVRIS